MSIFKIAAIDFDGTLCGVDFPLAGKPRMKVIRYVKSLKKRGWKLILWTCRSGKNLRYAVDWCRGYGLEFDAVNREIIQDKTWLKKTKNKVKFRKIFAHVYIDDRNVSLKELGRVNIEKLARIPIYGPISRVQSA